MDTKTLPTDPAEPDHPTELAEPQSIAEVAGGMVALPDADDVGLNAEFQVDAHLAEIQAARQRQLQALPATSLDAVAAAHRASVERILDEVASARRRLQTGLYAICVECSSEIPSERLQLRPWATTCASCAPRRLR
jgi:DnaK suppressor protein